MLFFIPLFGQQTGSIIGEITESKTKEKMPGVNIMVKGTYYGASTNLDGKYIISSITPGSYDVEVSMIGYKVILKTGVIINSGETIRIGKYKFDVISTLPHENILTVETDLSVDFLEPKDIIEKEMVKDNK